MTAGASRRPPPDAQAAQSPRAESPSHIEATVRSPLGSEDSASLRASLAAIAAQTRWLGRSVHWFEEIDSTNKHALALAAQGAEHGEAVIAEAQTAGRGRLGRSFFSPPRTNLYVSFVLRPRGSAAALGTLPLVAGIALAQVIGDELGDAARVQLKWPNDVLADEKKVSGILLERAGVSADSAVILGIGVNLNVDPATFPDDFRARASSLSALAARRIDRARFAATLFERLEDTLGVHAEHGFAALRQRFDALFRMSGRRVRVADSAGRVTEGVVLGIGADGSLRLGTYAGEERLLAGDVTLLKEPLA